MMFFKWLRCYLVSVKVPRSSSSMIQREVRPRRHLDLPLSSSIPLKERISHHMRVFPSMLHNDSFQWNCNITKDNYHFRKREAAKDSERGDGAPCCLGGPSLLGATTQHPESSQRQWQMFPVVCARFRLGFVKCCCEREILFISARTAKNEPEKL